VDDDRMLEIALVENIHREDLNPIEKARAYRRYLDELGFTHEDAAKRLGRDRSTITNQLRLLELPEDLQGMVSSGFLTMGHARALLGVEDDDRKREIAARIRREGLSVREAERLVRTERDGPERPKSVATPGAEKSAHFEDLERRLRERFGTKVRIDGGRERGKVVLEYYTMDDLNRLLELLLGD
jgi:ParB family chromosome partitioning protein